MRTLGDTTTHYFLLQRMARAIGADLTALEGEAWAGAVTRCRGCASADTCTARLGRAEATGAGLRAPPQACENRAMLRALRP